MLDWWSHEVQTYTKTHPVHLYIGLADYKVGNDSDAAWKNKMELPNQILANRSEKTAAMGQMHFSLKSMESNKLGYATIVNQQLYNYTALTPGTVWDNTTAPAEPTFVQVTKEASGRKIEIIDENAIQPRKYVIYRFVGNSEGSYDNPKNIVDVVYNMNGITAFVDKTALAKHSYTYGITAISATGVESKNAFVVKEGK